MKKMLLRGISVIVLVLGMLFIGCEAEGGNNDDKNTKAEYPTITLQPQSKVYFPRVTAEPLTVTASVSDGGSLSYQWYSRTTSYGNGNPIEGATTSSYTPSTATVGTVYYSVVVTNTNQGKTAERRSDSADIVTGFKEAKKFLSAVSSVAFGGDRFVIGRAYGQTAWSSDGINWTEVDASNVFGNISSVSAIAYGSGRFIAAGGYKMGWSTNGESWTEINANPAFNGTSDFVYGITYGNNRFFAWGSGTKTGYSDDNGATWKQASANKISTLGGITAGKDNFIKFGGTDSDSAYIEVFSTYWQGGTISTIAFINNMIYANNNLIAVGGNKAYKNSSYNLFSGSDWTDISPTIGSNSITSIGYGANRLIVFTSSDSSSSTPYKGICWSDDSGENWTEMPLETSYGSIVYGKGCFVTLGGNSVYYTIYQ